MDRVLSKEEVKELIESDEWAKTISKELEDVFKEHFYLSEEEIEAKIEEIFSRNRIGVAENLLGVFAKFIQLEKEDDKAINSSKNANAIELIRRRNKFAETAVDKILKYYLDQENTIRDEFFETLKRAKEGLKIDTRALAKIGAFNNASIKTYNTMIKVLVENDYKDNIQNVTFNIFDIVEDEETIKNLVEDCSTLLYRTSAKNVQEILDYISNFMWDSDAQRYVLSPKECFKKAHTLLTISPKALKDNINFLESHFGRTAEDHKELVNRVALSPSLLQIRPKKVEEFLDKLAECYVSLGVEAFEAINKASDFCYDIDNLNMISTITSKQMNNIEEVKKVLLNYGFGNENTISCLTSPYFIKTDPKVLDAVLAKISSEENFEQKNIKKLLIETASVLDTSLEAGEGLRTREGLLRKSRRIVAKDTSDKKISENVFLEKYEKLNKDERKEVDAILLNLTKRKEKKRRTNTTTNRGNTGSSDKENSENIVIPDFSDCESEYPFVEILNRTQKFYENNISLINPAMLNQIKELKDKYVKFRKAMQIDPKIYEQLGMYAKIKEEINSHLDERDDKNLDNVVKDAIKINGEIVSQLKEYHSNIRKNYLGSQTKFKELAERAKKNNNNNLPYTLSNSTLVGRFFNSLYFQIATNSLDEIKEIEDFYKFMSQHDKFNQILPQELLQKFNHEPLPEAEYMVLVTYVINDYEFLRGVKEKYKDILSEKLINSQMNSPKTNQSNPIIKTLNNLLESSEKLQNALSKQGRILYPHMPVWGTLKKCDGNLFLQLKNSCIDIPKLNANVDSLEIEEVDSASKPEVFLTLDNYGLNKYHENIMTNLTDNDNGKKME